MNGETTSALALPDEATFKQDMEAINRFQRIVHGTMVKGLDYGVIPGTQKPTLLKPGAEKIAKLLKLSDQYEIMDKIEDWKAPFFHYLIKCRLTHIVHGVVISEGLGECNSMESKYRWRWVGERDLPPGIDKSKLVSQERRGKTGGRWTVYRLDNEDIYSQVNTIVKMAEKRALVGAALSAGRLSDVFTQDMEDIGEKHEEDEPTTAPATVEAKKPKDGIPSSPATQITETTVFTLPNRPFTNWGEFMDWAEEWSVIATEIKQRAGVKALTEFTKKDGSPDFDAAIAIVEAILREKANGK